MTASLPRMIVADLDGTLLHDADTFEGRFITRRSIDAIHRLHDRGFIFAIATARPVSTGYEFVEKLPVDACVYLNGALIDLSPDRSDYDMLTSGVLPQDGHLLKIGFPSERAVQVCRYLLEAMPGLKVGIVMDVQTGAILAMTSQPDYDPNDPRTIVNEEIRNAVNALEGEQRSEALQTAQQAQWRNKAISDLYEPGSVFKLITAAAALDTGACTPDSQFVCAGSINVAGTRFRCANGHIHGLETFAQGLAVSCNPCFIQIGARLGKEAFCDYFAAFGLREATGIDLPGEIKQSEY